MIKNEHIQTGLLAILTGIGLAQVWENWKLRTIQQRKAKQQGVPVDDLGDADPPGGSGVPPVVGPPSPGGQPLPTESVETIDPPPEENLQVLADRLATGPASIGTGFAVAALP